MYKKTLWLLLIFILLIGCTQKDDDQVRKKDNHEDIPEEQGTDDIKEQEKSLSVHSIDMLKDQVGGTLTKNMTLTEEIEQVYHIPSEKLDNQLKKITETSNDAEEIYQNIVLLLGSPHYDETIKEAEEFEPIFINPYLPSTERERDEIWESDKAIILFDINMDPTLKEQVIDTVSHFAEVIGQNKEISLVITNGDNNGMENIYPISTYDKETFENAIEQIDTMDTEETSLASTIANIIDMKSAAHGETVTVYIFTDGGELQQADVVHQAEDLSNIQEEIEINVIGIQVNQSENKILNELDEEGYIRYYSANSEEDMRNIIENHLLSLYAVDLGWVYQQSPGPWEVLDEYDRFDVELNQIRGIIKSEKERYDLALRKMREKEWIDREVATTVADIILDDYRVKLELASNLRSEKLDEIDRQAEFIRNRVETWVENMQSYK